MASKTRVRRNPRDYARAQTFQESRTYRTTKPRVWRAEPPKPVKPVVNTLREPIRNGIEIDAAPIMAEQHRLEALRSRRGLVSEWARIINGIEPELRAMAHMLMAEITEFFVRRAAAPKQLAFAWA